MVGEAQSIKTQVFVPGRDKHRRFQRLLTFDIITDWIKKQGLDEYTTNGLIELASRYPTQALPSFRRNFNLMIQRVRQKRREEQNQPEDVVEEIIPIETPVAATEEPVVEESTESEDENVESQSDKG